LGYNTVLTPCSGPSPHNSGQVTAGDDNNLPHNDIAPVLQLAEAGWSVAHWAQQRLLR